MEKWDNNGMKKINFDSQSLADKYLSSNSEYSKLLADFVNGKKTLTNILDKAISKIKPLTEDHDLKSFFFYISEISELDKEFKSFALDVSEYLSGMFDVSGSYRGMDIQKEYKEKRVRINM